ncbi:MAG: hypothetical protein P8105_10980, partial [Dehalococcoidia bacterium]
EGKPLNSVTLRPSEPLDMMVDIINTESQPASYKLQIFIAGTLYEETYIEDLEFEQVWHKQFSISPELESIQEQVECLLTGEIGGIPNVEQSRSFIIETGEPYAPQLLSPADKASINGNTITYRWNTSPGSTSYVLEINTDPEWDNKNAKFKADVGNITEYTDVGYPNDGTTYYWRVFAKNNASRSPASEVEDNSREFVNK